jgi:hypothetical protein
MSERYSKIYSLPENLYSQGSPVIIKAGTLLKDNESNWLIAQIKLQNISDKPIKYAKVELTLFDSMNRPIDVPFSFDYLDLFANRGMDFGSKTPIKIAKSTTRSYTIRVIEVGYLDNTMWSANENEWDSIPQQTYASSTLADKNKITGYKSFFGNGANFIACEHKDLWCCACGEINHHGEENCYKCNASFNELQNIDATTLETEGIYATATQMATGNNASEVQKAKKMFESIADYKDSAGLMESCDAKLETLQAKKGKLKIIISIISWVLFGLSAIPTLLNFVFDDKDVYLATICLGIGSLVLLATSLYVLKFTLWTEKNEKFKKNTKASLIIAAIIFLLQPLEYFVAYPLISKAMGDYGVIISVYNLEEFTVPEGTTEIKDYAFSYCWNLKKVTIPDSVTSIGDSAFYRCSSLTNITIPESVTSIGDSAFSDCDGLTSITIPDSVTSIGERAFSHCDSLTSVTISDSVTSIGSYTFYGCESLENVTIGKGVKAIGYDAFWYCNNIKNVYITDIAAWCGIEFDPTYSNPLNGIYKLYINNEYSAQLVIPDGVTSIGDHAFYNYKGLTRVTIPDSVTSIGSGAFYWCENLRSVTIPDSVTSIESNAFASCLNLQTIYYSGTTYEWESLVRSNPSFYSTYGTTVYCSNGTYKK